MKFTFYVDKGIYSKSIYTGSANLEQPTIDNAIDYLKDFMIAHKFEFVSLFHRATKRTHESFICTLQLNKKTQRVSIVG